MARYVDGFIVPVPKNNVDAYRRMARKAGKVWREHGALEYIECIGDDVKPGKFTSFPQSVKLKPDEVVFFSWIIYKSRKDRDRINAKVMKDPRLASMMDPTAMPFDGKRMIYGGFKTAVEFFGRQRMIYKGSCHCGNVAFEAKGEIAGAMACNCSICQRKGALMWFVPRDKLRLLTPDGNAATYTFNKHVIQHRFCPKCGMHPYGEGVDPKGNVMAAINIRCLEDIDLAAIPVQHFDGRSI